MVWDILTSVYFFLMGGSWDGALLVPYMSVKLKVEGKVKVITTWMSLVGSAGINGDLING